MHALQEIEQLLTTLTRTDLANAWAYARAHREEIEHQIHANETA
jgi:hypothetical protein